MNRRLHDLRISLRRLSLEALVISDPSNIFYISGFRGHDSCCLVTSSSGIIITDFRYSQEASAAAAGFQIICGPGALIEKTGLLISKRSLKKVGFESSNMSYKDASALSRLANKKLIPVDNVIEDLRIIKAPAEIRLMTRAADIARLALKKSIKEIIRGRKESLVAAGLEFSLKAYGADAAAFESIVACGPNSSMPHAKPGTSRIRLSQPIIIDCGASQQVDGAIFQRILLR